jgi:hypothetical protein
MWQKKSNDNNNKNIHASFNDSEKAFNSVDRKILCKILNYYGVPDKLFKITIAFYEDSEYSLSTENEDMTFFKIMFGVKQGFVLSYSHSCWLLL